MKKWIVIGAEFIFLMPVVFYFEPAGTVASASTPDAVSILDAILGMVSLISFLTFLACAASLWLHLDRSNTEAAGGMISPRSIFPPL